MLCLSQTTFILGKCFQNGLGPILDSPEFKKLRWYDVDNIEKCKSCEYRYLCGGACRAWNGEAGQYQLDAAPNECEGLKNRAKEIVETARKFILDDEL